ncbi:MAG: MarR family transcriptional regulator [Deltaproteobacteria bacterium]|nr:MarR family transcriptional regulator [Candidatus Zymogenaceae bacterium]
MADNREMVLNAITSAGGPVRPGDIADATGLSKDEVSRIIKVLKDEGKIVSPKRCYYAPAE